MVDIVIREFLKETEAELRVGARLKGNLSEELGVLKNKIIR